MKILLACAVILALSGCTTMESMLHGMSEGLMKASQDTYAPTPRSTQCTSLVSGNMVNTSCN
jgi:uncharacterized protein YceK